MTREGHFYSRMGRPLQLKLRQLVKSLATAALVATT
jgi:hypothetical protein